MKVSAKSLVSPTVASPSRLMRTPSTGPGADVVGRARALRPAARAGDGDLVGVEDVGHLALAAELACGSAYSPAVGNVAWTV